MTVYLFAFLVTLASAVIAGAIRGGDSARVAIILVLSFILANVAWDLPDPIIGQAMGDLLCAAFIVVVCSERWAMGVAFLFVLAVFCSVYAQFVSGYMLLYAHALSTLGHAQNIGTLIGGSPTSRVPWKMGDMGIRYRRGGFRGVFSRGKGSS